VEAGGGVLPIRRWPRTKTITWEQAMNSEKDLAPDDLAWDSEFQPDPMPMPGKTKFI